MRFEHRTALSHFEWIDRLTMERLQKMHRKFPFAFEKPYVQKIYEGNEGESEKLISNLLLSGIAQNTPLAIRNANIRSLCLMFAGICDHFHIENPVDTKTLLSAVDATLIRDHLMQAHRQISQASRIAQSAKDDQFEKVLQYIGEHYTEDISLETIAKHFMLSYSHLSRSFKEQTGQNYVEYITGLRIEKAKILLRKPDVLVKDVAKQVGYTNVNSFIRNFNKRVGISPGQYQRNDQ